MPFGINDEVLDEEKPKPFGADDEVVTVKPAKTSGLTLSDLIAPKPAKPGFTPETVDSIAAAATHNVPLGSQWLLKQALTRGGKVGDIAAEVIPAIAGGVGGSFAAPGLGTAAGGAAGAAVGNTLSQARRMIRGEQDAMKLGELGTATAAGAIPVGKIKNGVLLVKSLGVRGAQGGGIAGASNVASQAIDKGEVDMAEAARTAAIGAGVGMLFRGVEVAPDVIRRVKNKVTGSDTWKQAVAKVLPEKTLGALHEPLKAVPGAIASLSRDGFRANKALKDALDKSPDEADAAFQYLTGGLHITSLSPAVSNAAKAVRDSVDAMSDMMIKTGLAEGELRHTIVSNQGRYLRRAYKLFETPNYKPEPADLNNFVNAYVEDGLDQAVMSGVAVSEAELRQKGLNVAAYLLAKGNGTAFQAAENFIVKGSASIGKSGELFKPRKNLDEATRKLLGEIVDPVDAANQTIPRMARILAQDDAQKKLREIGLKTGMFKTNASEGAMVPVAMPESQAYDQLGGLFTTPEIQTALQRVTGPDDWGVGWKVLASATQISKFGKTVLNPISYAPNLISSVMGPLQQGHVTAMFNGRNWNDAAGVVMDEIGLHQAPAVLEKRIKFLTEQRILNESFNFRDLQRTMDEALIQIPGSAKRVLKGTAKVYSGSESLGRVLNFAGEMSRYRRAFPDMPEEELMLKAAEVTRAVVPNYSEIPGIVKKLSTSGALETFVNFSYEQFRNTYNGIKLGMKDLAEGQTSGNKALAAEGAKRLAAITSFVVGGSAWGLSAFSKRKAGVSDEEEAALRRRVPEYDKAGTWYMNELTPEQFAYSNQSYIFPASITTEAIGAAARGDDPAAAAKAFALTLTGQLAGDGGVVLKPMMEAIFDETSFGRRISTPEASPATQKAQQAGYFLDRAFMPGIKNTAVKFMNAMKGERGPDGQEYRIDEQFKRLAGMRVSRLNIPYRFEREAYGFSKRLSEVSKATAAVRRDDPQAAYAQSEEGRKKVFADIQQYLADAKTLKQDQEKMIVNLKTAGVPAQLILSAIDGQYIPGRDGSKPTASEILASMRLLPADQQKAEFNRLALEDRSMANAVRSLQREELYDEKLGRTQYDKLIGSLNKSDGERARYLQARMDAMPTPEARREYLREMQRKGFVPADVYRQLTENRLFK